MRDDTAVPWYVKLAFVVGGVALLVILSFRTTHTARQEPLDVCEIARHITYFRDGSLCFAEIESRTYLGWNVVSLTSVPCSAFDNWSGSMNLPPIKIPDTSTCTAR